MSDTILIIVTVAAFLLLATLVWRLPTLGDSFSGDMIADAARVPEPELDPVLKQALAKLDEVFVEQQRLAKRVAEIEKFREQLAIYVSEELLGEEEIEIEEPVKKKAKAKKKAKSDSEFLDWANSKGFGIDKPTKKKAKKASSKRA